MAKKAKVPKRLAGVKIPKALRRGLKDLAGSLSGRAAMTDMLAAAGAALAAIEGQSGPCSRGFLADKAPPAKARAGKVAGEARSWTGGALEDAARAFTEALRRRSAPEGPVTAAPAQPPSPAPH